MFRKKVNGERSEEMRKSRFSEGQIISILKEAEAGISVEEICRKNTISQATYY